MFRFPKYFRCFLDYVEADGCAHHEVKVDNSGQQDCRAREDHSSVGDHVCAGENPGRAHVDFFAALLLQEPQKVLDYYWKEARPRLEASGSNLPASLEMVDPHEAVISFLRGVLNPEET